ncbi:hypothetical protein TNCV_4057491 [Trichonephila clavipes]|nr:hypothetical protein TNCV_4057491 [Trichonephila clavipes]
MDISVLLSYSKEPLTSTKSLNKTSLRIRPKLFFIPLSDKRSPEMLRIRKTGKSKCRNARVSLKTDFVDESVRKAYARRISGRRIQFSNRFPKISVTLPDNVGRPYLRHTVAGP